MINQDQNNSRCMRRRRGFTLLEVLVAASIFAMVMVMTTATVAQSSNYKNKLNTLRELNEDSRLLSDTITRDIRSASEPLVLDAAEYGECPADGSPIVTPTSKKFKNGIALLAWRETSCFEFNYNSTPSPEIIPIDFNGVESSLKANVLIISAKDSYIIYLSGHNVDFSETATPELDTTFHVFRQVIPKTVITDGKLDYLDIGSTANKNYILSSKNVETYINFGGFAPDDETISLDPTINAQPFVQFYLNSRTKGFASKPVHERAIAQIRSAVTSRSYNP